MIVDFLIETYIIFCQQVNRQDSFHRSLRTSQHISPQISRRCYQQVSLQHRQQASRQDSLHHYLTICLQASLRIIRRCNQPVYQRRFDRPAYRSTFIFADRSTYWSAHRSAENTTFQFSNHTAFWSSYRTASYGIISLHFIANYLYILLFDCNCIISIQ